MTNVISIDDHELIGFGLEKIFSETENIRLVKNCSSMEELKEFLSEKSDEEKNDLVAMIDIKLKDESGFDCGDFLVSQKIPCLIFSSYANAGFVVKSMEHKINGFISKNADKSEIIDAVNTVYSGGTYIQKDLIQNTMFACGILVTLTKKERCILDLVTENYSNDEISEKLFISKRTVENYISRIFDKLNVKNRYELKKLL